MKKFLWWGLGLLTVGLGAWWWFSGKKSSLPGSGNPRLDPTGETGTTRGERNNNPCNITPNAGDAWHGQVGVDTTGDTAYSIFDTPRNGIRAAGVNALHYYYRDGRTTLDDFSVWGPAGNTDYGEKLAQTLGIPSNLNADVPNNLENILKAISINENSEVPYTESDWADGTKDALAKVTG